MASRQEGSGGLGRSRNDRRWCWRRRRLDGDRIPVEGCISRARRRRADAEGSIDFQLDPPLASWHGTIHYADYWYDPSGEWYVAFVEGCRDGPVCEPFVLQLVDGRARADKMEEVSLTWSTRQDFEPGRFWEVWYRIDDGAVVVPNVP